MLFWLLFVWSFLVCCGFYSLRNFNTFKLILWRRFVLLAWICLLIIISSVLRLDCCLCGFCSLVVACFGCMVCIWVWFLPRARNEGSVNARNAVMPFQTVGSQRTVRSVDSISAEPRNQLPKNQRYVVPAPLLLYPRKSRPLYQRKQARETIGVSF